VFILDTDAITHDQHAHPVLSVRVRNTPREDLFTTSVTVEEQLKGRLAYIHRYRNDPPRLAQGHAALMRTIYYFARWNILSISEEAEVLVRQLRQQHIRIGSQDLRIAALALLYGCTVVTSNVRDFSQVPDLSVADWTVTPQ
jgi:tRNA(fMet)-specific endonuclease VapC